MPWAVEWPRGDLASGALPRSVCRRVAAGKQTHTARVSEARGLLPRPCAPGPAGIAFAGGPRKPPSASCGLGKSTVTISGNCCGGGAVPTASRRRGAGALGSGIVGAAGAAAVEFLHNIQRNATNFEPPCTHAHVRTRKTIPSYRVP